MAALDLLGAHSHHCSDIPALEYNLAAVTVPVGTLLGVRLLAMGVESCEQRGNASAFAAFAFSAVVVVVVADRWRSPVSLLSTEMYCLSNYDSHYAAWNCFLLDPKQTPTHRQAPSPQGYR